MVSHTLSQGKGKEQRILQIFYVPTSSSQYDFKHDSKIKSFFFLSTHLVCVLAINCQQYQFVANNNHEKIAKRQGTVSPIQLTLISTRHNPCGLRRRIWGIVSPTGPWHNKHRFIRWIRIKWSRDLWTGPWSRLSRGRRGLPTSKWSSRRIRWRTRLFV
jgi:hypothetical protein